MYNGPFWRIFSVWWTGALHFYVCMSCGHRSSPACPPLAVTAAIKRSARGRVVLRLIWASFGTMTIARNSPARLSRLTPSIWSFVHVHSRSPPKCQRSLISRVRFRNRNRKRRWRVRGGDGRPEQPFTWCSGDGWRHFRRHFRWHGLCSSP